MANLFGCETFHVGGGHNMFQEICKLPDVGIDSDFVLPFKFHPHLAKLCFGAGSRLDIVHDVNVDVVEYNTVAIRC